MKLQQNKDTYTQKQLSMMPKFMEAEVSDNGDSYLFSDKRTGQYLGTAPKSKTYKAMVLPIAIQQKTEEGYEVNILGNIPPDNRTYHWVKDICQKNGIHLPPYDARAYKDFIVNRKKNMIRKVMDM